MNYHHSIAYICFQQVLLNFLQGLSFKFVYRIHKERYKKDTWEGKVGINNQNIISYCRNHIIAFCLKAPESHRLTDEEITRFVQILRPAAFLALYSKLQTTAASHTIRLLATIRPELILPELLEK